MIITQEQVNKYVEESLQPLSDDLTDYAKGKNIPPPDFYMACAGITRCTLERIGTPKSKKVLKELDGILGAWCTEELRMRMERVNK